MGNHRMFTNTITDSDLFLEMSLSAQALYFHLGLHADDEGFVSSPKRIVRATGCNEDDLKLLIAKGFVICFDSGIIVITHWNLHNNIRKDRKKETFFKNEKALLLLNNGVYSEVDNQMTTKCHPSVNQMSAQVKISKDKISKDNKIYMSTSVDPSAHFDYKKIVNSFNSICISLPKVQKITETRKKKIKNLQKHLGNTAVEDYFSMVESSDFLTGRTEKWTGCNFDWVLKPENITKVIEGNYANKQVAPNKRIYKEEEW
ncbi:MAG: replisome organizer [Ruminococcus sp.]|nr:replisome organizer [Ruminococcus sp.]